MATTPADPSIGGSPTGKAGLPMPFDLTAEHSALLQEYVLPFVFAILIFTVGWLSAKWGHALALKALRTSRLDEVTSRFLASAVQWGMLAIAVIAALEKAGVETTSLAAIVAAAGLAIGLALQGTLGHFAGGVLLLLFRPFTLSDRVTVAGGHTGRVEDIGLFATTLSTPAREHIILPNATITSSAITNHTASGNLRAVIDVGVAYGSDLDQIGELLLEAAAESSLVLEEPRPQTGLIDFAASSLTFRIICWSEPRLAIPMEVQMRSMIYRKFLDAGVEIPFDQLVVHRGAAP